ncbi:hypothetical protein BURMUCF2_A1217 [Burkholderia multivorans CF2]|nr:hypothetical protein BURMUCF2_A1217 [Burkholderia multivorans CF2]
MSIAMPGARPAARRAWRRVRPRPTLEGTGNVRESRHD